MWWKERWTINFYNYKFYKITLMSLDSSSNSAPVRFWVGDFLWKINLNENKSIYNIKLWFDLRHVLQDKCVCVCVLVTEACPTLCNPMNCSLPACQPPLSEGFAKQEYWYGLPFPSPGNLPNPGIESQSPALQADSLPSEPYSTIL